MGWSYRSIAAHEQCHTSTAHERVQSALRNMVKEPCEDVRILELYRLDAMLAVAQERAETGDDAAIKSVLAIQDRRARYLGLDITRTEVTVRAAAVVLTPEQERQLAESYLASLEPRDE